VQFLSSISKVKKRETYRELTVFSEVFGEKRAEISPIIGTPISSKIHYSRYFACNTQDNLNDAFEHAQDKNSCAPVRIIAANSKRKSGIVNRYLDPPIRFGKISNETCRVLAALNGKYSLQSGPSIMSLSLVRFQIAETAAPPL
jgi:hypothetical protein